MINPVTKKEFTEVELLYEISRDVSNLGSIEYALGEEGEGETISNNVADIKSRTDRQIEFLFSIKKLLIAIVCLLAGLLLFSIFK